MFDFCRECRENLNIRVLRTKFWVKSACEDDPQVVPAWDSIPWIRCTIVPLAMFLIKLIFDIIDIEFIHQFAPKCYIYIQAGTTCGASSQADLTKNLVLKTRILRFSRHSRQKCRKQSFLRQKRAVMSLSSLMTKD